MFEPLLIAQIGLPIPMALASVALIGYLVGRWKRAEMLLPGSASRRDIARARKVAQTFETISRQVQTDIAEHWRQVRRFQRRLDRIATDDDSSWLELCDEAERILGPTQRYVTQLAHAYDSLRQQANQLMTFTELRNDPLTGVHNRRGLDEALKLMFAMLTRYRKDFSILMVDIDYFKQINDRHGHLRGDQILRELAELMVQTARDADVVTRYGGEEFSIVLPETTLQGACEFAERLRRKIQETLTITVSLGVAQARHDDSPSGLLDRADSALYTAKSEGRNCVYHCDAGEAVRVTERTIPRTAAQAESADEALSSQHIDEFAEFEASATGVVLPAEPAAV